MPICSFPKAASHQAINRKSLHLLAQYIPSKQPTQSYWHQCIPNQATEGLILTSDINLHPTLQIGLTSLWGVINGPK